MTTYGSLGGGSHSTATEPLLSERAVTGGSSKKNKLVSRSLSLVPLTSTATRRSTRVLHQPVLKTITSKRSVATTTTTSSRATTDDGATGTLPHVTEEGQPLQPPSPHQASKKKQHSFVYTMLNPRSSSIQATIFKWFITFVIVADLLAFILSTDPKPTKRQMEIFSTWEAVDSYIFAVEYILRVMTVTESNKYGKMGPIWGRMRWMITAPALIDLASTLPYFLECFTNWNLPTLTYLRSFRLLRILKTNGFSEATKSVCRVFYYNSEILYVAAMIGIGLVGFTAVLMYYLRPRDQDHPEFRSIPNTLYLSTLMLTGQGGPDGEIPWYTSLVVLLTGVFSIGMFAIPASMLTWGFEAEAQRYAMLARRRKEKATQVAAAAAGDTGAQAAVSQEQAEDLEHDNWSYSSDDYSTDEEYQKIIAGEDDDDDEDEEDRIRRQFELADIDHSGNITLGEFFKLSQNMQSGGAASGRKDNLKAFAPGLSARLEVLEKKQDENSAKLDRICNILESLQKSKK